MAQRKNDYEFYKQEIDAYIEEEADNQPEPVYEKFMSVETTSLATFDAKTIATYGPMVQVDPDEGDAVTDRLTDGYRTQFPILAYRKAASFTSELFETDQLNEIERIARSMPRAVRYSREQVAAGVLRNGWNSAVTYGDGQSLFSLSHPLSNGSGVQANTFEDGVQRPLNYDNVKRLEDVLQAFTSNSGNILGTAAMGKNMVLFVTPNQREAGLQIIDPIYQPDTADNNSNYFVKGSKYDLLVIPHLRYESARQAGETGSITKGSSSNFWDTMWGIFDPEISRQYMKMYIREGYENGRFDEEVRKSNQTVSRYAYDKLAVGAIAPFGSAGSMGNSATIT